MPVVVRPTETLLAVSKIQSAGYVHGEVEERGSVPPVEYEYGADSLSSSGRLRVEE